jgi:hypothetical protein
MSMVKKKMHAFQKNYADLLLFFRSISPQAPFGARRESWTNRYVQIKGSCCGKTVISVGRHACCSE